MTNGMSTPAKAAGEGDLTRRDFVRGAAVTGIVVGGSEYVKPMLKLVGVTRLASATSVPPVETTVVPPPVTTPTVARHGCTPGFWSNNGTSRAAGGGWWDAASDPQWAAAGGHGTNPFTHTTLFNSFFAPQTRLAGLTMFAILNGGGSDVARRTARQLIAAYLNASFGPYAHTPAQLRSMWSAAVAGGNVTLRTLNELLDDTNSECNAGEDRGER